MNVLTNKLISNYQNCAIIQGKKLEEILHLYYYYYNNNVCKNKNLHNLKYKEVHILRID